MKPMEQYLRRAGTRETLHNEPIITDVHLTIQ